MIREFIYKYYIDPITTGGAYTLVDTLTYALILIIAVFLIHRWMTRSGLPFDRDLLFSTLPWVVLGGLLRVLEDTGLIAAPWRYLLITPLIFFVLFFYACTLYSARFMVSGRHYTGIGWITRHIFFNRHGVRPDLEPPSPVPAIILNTRRWRAWPQAFLRYVSSDTGHVSTRC